jgi:hypothetical protein
MKKQRKNFIVLTVLFSLIITLQAQTPLTQAVDFNVTDTDGEQHSLFSYLNSGYYVCIDFFYATCSACQATAPKVSYAYEYFGCNTGYIIFLGIDNGDTDAEVIAFENNYGATYPSASGIEGGSNSVVNSYQISAFPTVILIAPDKNIVKQDIWPIADGNYLVSVIEPYGPAEHTCDTSANINFVKNEYSIKFFPNPAKDAIYIKSDSHLKLIIYNLLGDILKKPEICKGQSIINISDLSKGIYFLQIKDENGYIVETRKIIKE